MYIDTLGTIDFRKTTVRVLNIGVGNSCYNIDVQETEIVTRKISTKASCTPTSDDYTND